MPVDVVMLVATAVLATVAVAAAVVATRASRRVARAQRDAAVAAPAVVDRPAPAEERPVVVTTVRERPAELAPRVVEGRVVVPPSRDEVVRTALSRPQVRLAVLAHGIASALRPESRDRIAALVRREYRERRRYRLRAGRRAARAAHQAPALPAAPAEHWLGEVPPFDEAPGRGSGPDRAIGA